MNRETIVQERCGVLSAGLIINASKAQRRRMTVFVVLLNRTRFAVPQL